MRLLSETLAIHFSKLAILSLLPFHRLLNSKPSATWFLILSFIRDYIETYSDLIIAKFNNLFSTLKLLNLSIAFDIVNHSLLATPFSLIFMIMFALGSFKKLFFVLVLIGSAHMIEADVLLPYDESEQGQPIMAHPPEMTSDNTLREWLSEVLKTNKGIKLDFKSLTAVKPSMILLENIKMHLNRPLWINADILPGPNGKNNELDAKKFLDTVTSFFPTVTLSLGWTTRWYPHQFNEGYNWTMVKDMEHICNKLSQPITFPVRAALVRQSCDQLLWLVRQSNRYSLTIWTGKDDKFPTEDLLYIRERFGKRQVFYDILEPQNQEFKQAIGIETEK
uniref:Family with sequence similarity 151 member B n=1 Tax=Monodelphis domestica TaxID=13616 RepID=F6SG82_MONDO